MPDLDRLPQSVRPISKRDYKLLQKHPEQTVGSKVGHWVGFVALGVIALALGILLFWGLSSNDVLEVKNAPFPVRTVRQHASPNGVVILNVDYCKKVSTEGNLRMSFVSPTREVLLPMARERGPKGCFKTEFPVLLPKDITPDTYKVRFRVTYQVNPLKQVMEEFESKEFIVE